MAGSIKGIIVEIGGDTSGLQKALSKVSSATSSLSKELRGINSLLKLDPKNTELVTQKQQVLSETIKDTENKLKLLHSTYDRAVEAEANGSKISEENWRNIQREIINTENKLKALKLEASNWTKAGKSIEEYGEKITKVSTKIENLGNKLTTRLSLPIAGLATAGIKYNADIEKYTKSFKTFLGSAEKAANVVEKIKKDAGSTPFDITSLIQANQMLISTNEDADSARETILALGDAITATGGGNDELTRMAANLQQVKNAGVATALDIKQFAYAGIDIYGLLADYTGKSVQEVKDMKVSYEVLTEALKKANKQGGKYFNAMSDASEALTGQVNKLKAEVKDAAGNLTKSLMPTAKKVVNRAEELINKFNQLSDSEKENIIKIGLMVAAFGPLEKIVGKVGTTAGSAVKGIGVFSQAIGVMKTGASSGVASIDNLAKGLSILTNPATIAATGITIATGVIIAQIKKAEQEVTNSLENVGNGATNFINGISSATSHLDSFNSTLFASSQEQENLKKNMDEVQQGITNICKKAADERRGYTQEEITQLEEYFNKLRELKNREIEIQQSVANAISQQAITNAESFQGTLEEYKVQSQEWIKTAEEQKDSTLNIIKDGTTQEIALLNQKYGEQANMQNEAYSKEYNNIMQHQQEKIDAANSEVAKVVEAYSNGYLQRANQDNSFYKTFTEYNKKIEDENQKHAGNIDNINNNVLLTQYNKNKAKEDENYRHEQETKKIWQKMYKDMDESQEEQLGVWLAQVAQTELYGGKIDEKTQKIVSSIVDSYDSMPNKTRDAMKNAMEPMLTEMENKEPSLFAKATGIAEGILSRLKKAFDIHSPSRKVRKIFNFAMEGAEVGIEDKENALYSKIKNISNTALERFKQLGNDVQLGALNQSVMDKTKTVFTTPQIVFNVQELDEAKLNQCLNYINRKFGSKY